MFETRIIFRPQEPLWIDDCECSLHLRREHVDRMQFARIGQFCYERVRVVFVHLCPKYFRAIPPQRRDYPLIDGPKIRLPIISTLLYDPPTLYERPT